MKRVTGTSRHQPSLNCKNVHKTFERLKLVCFLTKRVQKNLLHYTKLFCGFAHSGAWLMTSVVVEKFYHYFALGLIILFAGFVT